MSDNDFNPESFFPIVNFKKYLGHYSPDSGTDKIECLIYGVVGNNDKDVVAICYFDESIKREDRAEVMAKNGCYSKIVEACAKNQWNLLVIRYMTDEETNVCVPS